MASNGWENFYAAGENAKGMVAQTANNTTINAGQNNDTGEVPPNPDYLLNENIPTMVQVSAYTRRSKGSAGPSLTKGTRRGG